MKSISYYTLRSRKVKPIFSLSFQPGPPTASNDFTPGVPERGSYVAAYAAFVRTLLRNHPHAQVVLTEGATLDGENKETMKSYIAGTIARVRDARVHAVASTHYPGDAADAHPTGAQHARMAGELAPQLRRVMGW